jgi:hypothetical protein
MWCMHCMLRQTISVTCDSLICLWGIVRLLPSLEGENLFHHQSLARDIKVGAQRIHAVQRRNNPLWANSFMALI